MEDSHSKQGGLDNPISAWALMSRLKFAVDMVSPDTKSILDIGCGEGHFIKIISERYPAKLVGLDISKDNIDYARRLVPKARFIAGDASKLPFIAHSFDCIILLEVLDHFERENTVLSEVKRVLKKDGEIILSVPDTNKMLWNVGWYIWTHIIGRKWLGAHKRNFNEGSIRRTLEKSGFKVIEIKRVWNCVMTIKAKPKN
jgi:ubiquinone/menaquinone biosynthesis C-methylase UbiE